MRIGIISIQHESNTFVLEPTTLDDFKHDVLASGEDVRRVFQDALHEVGGFFSGLDEAGVEAVPIFAARAVPGGIVTQETFDYLTTEMLNQLETAGPLDGLLVAPHGAGVCESVRDMDGHWLGLVRDKIGRSVPMICTLDAHANVSQRMIDLCDATIVYRTNPHLDQHERGLEAARLMVRTVRGEVKPTQAICLSPVAINIERQHTESEPCKSLIGSANQMLQIQGVLSNSVVLGFPYADVEEMGASFVVVTDGDSDLANKLVKQLGAELLTRRKEFVAHLISVKDALDQASVIEGPVCLLDMGDNVGGGSSADGTLILHAVQKSQGPSCCACLYDPKAVQLAIKAGVDSQLAQFAMGGKLDARMGTPLIADVRVISIHDGTFTENEVRHGGKTEYKMGPSVVVETDYGTTILLNSFRTPPFSLKQLTSCDIDPTQFQLLIAKGVQAPLAAYSPVCPNAIRVNTTGSTCADMLQLDYEHRRKPLFPFEQEVNND
ncbi:MAG: M81 family metallopeptidase [Planctomycetaceae bacterium]|nr:M81 family metallopeptidase [Planctomycetaceae bacterium]